MSRDAGQFLLDTGVVGAIGVGGSLAERIDASTHIRSSSLRPLISVVTRGEIVAFMRGRKWGEPRQTAVEELLKNLVVVSIDDRAIWDAFADLKNFAESTGRAIGDNDLWIAATARVLGVTLLTTDKDFDPLHEKFIDRVYFDPKA